jgi:NAD(P)-dependent dehydrogenase (short-subunit alcohol dehydrogenase family)
MCRLIPGLIAAVILMFTSVLPVAAESSGTVFITGANRGIGLAMAEKFSRAGYEVIGTARRPGAATALQALGARVLLLDVADPESVAALSVNIGDEAIDILINNAGMVSEEAAEFSDVNIEALLQEYQVNALGPMRVTQALLPNVLAGEQKIVANVSSMMGSMELNTFGCCMGYRASKAALNSFTKTLAVDMAEQKTIFVVLHPGYVRTDMNGGEGNITAAQSAAGLFEVITGLEKSDDGKFYNYDGKAMPW